MHHDHDVMTLPILTPTMTSHYNAMANIALRHDIVLSFQLINN